VQQGIGPGLAAEGAAESRQQHPRARASADRGMQRGAEHTHSALNTSTGFSFVILRAGP
jgi:hypothetical protein